MLFYSIVKVVGFVDWSVVKVVWSVVKVVWSIVKVDGFVVLISS